MIRESDQAPDAGYGVAPPGYRLPPDTRLGRVRLQVADLERSLAYYQRVIGLRLLERDEGRALLAAADGAPLVELRERPGAAPAPRGGRPGLYHFAILLPDRAALGRFVAHLSEAGERAGASDHFVSEALYLSDPDGLGIEVYADRPRSVWRHEARQLRMTTEPLDLGDLVRAAGGERWMGMPAGTTLGHVHLHVGDIAEAEAFYHRGVGFDKVVWSYPGALFLSAGGYHHHLGVNTWAQFGGPAGADDAGLLDWEVLLPSGDEVRRVAESLAAAGFAAERTGGELTARDPWGTTLRVRAESAS